jgi:hypothetical protein
MAEEYDEVQVCGRCRDSEWSAPVAVVLVWHGNVERPVPLIPAEEYCVCRKCRSSVTEFVGRACASSAKTRDRGLWSRAIVFYDDGTGKDLLRVSQRTANA